MTSQWVMALLGMPTVTSQWVMILLEISTELEDNSTLENNINRDPSRLKSYFDTNRLSINVTKYEFRQIGPYQSIAKMSNLVIYINNEPLKKVCINC